VLQVAEVKKVVAQGGNDELQDGAAVKKSSKMTKMMG
jgi:hypothetical protein